MKKITLLCMVMLLFIGVQAQKTPKPTERTTVTKSSVSTRSANVSVSAADAEAMQNAGNRTFTVPTEAQASENPLVATNHLSVNANPNAVEMPVNTQLLMQLSANTTTRVPTGTTVLNYRSEGDGVDLEPMLTSIGFNVTTETGFQTFNTAITAGYDLVIFQQYLNEMDMDDVTAMVNYIAGGGKVIFSYWNLDATPALLSAFEVATAVDYTAPLQVNAWDVSHPIFTTPNAIANIPTNGMDPTFDDGDRMQPAGGALALGGFTPTTSPGEAGIILDTTGNTFVNAFTYPSMDLATIINLIENQAEFLFGAASPIINECGVGLPSPFDPPSLVSSDATVTPTGIVGTGPGEYNIDFVSFDATANWASDISLTLTAPDGVTTIDLSSNNGPGPASGTQMDTEFRDDSANLVTNWNSGNMLPDYQAEGGLLNTIFAGQDVNGTWNLTLNDICCNDGGTWNEWCIEFTQNSLIDPDAPIMNCPGDVTLDASPGECSAPYGFATPPAVDPGGGSVTVVQTMGPPSPGPFPVGETIVEFTATNDDAPNEVTTCQFIVTVIDNQPPMLTCPEDITQTNDPGICGAVVTFDDPEIMDNCAGGPTDEVLFPTENSVFNGNARGYVFTAPVDFTMTGVQIPDDTNTDPQSIQIMRFSAIPAAFPGTSAYDELLFYMNNITDPGYFPVSIDVTAGDVIGILGVRGTNRNSYTTQPDITIDGNTVTIERFLTQNTINTVQAPQGSFSTEPASANKSRVNFTYTTGTGAGGGTLDQTAGLPSGSVFPVGTTTNTFVYTDQGGNSAECSFDVTVTDDEAPEVVCIGGPMPATGTATATPGLGIPDGDPAGITTTLEITEDFDITDLDLDIDISHTWIGDLTVSLTAPDGVTTAVLIDRPGYTGTGFGCDGTDIIATLDDEAATPVEDECGAGVPSISGSFIPNEALSVFDGMSTLGTWTLFLSDSATPDPGTLNSWSLNYDYNALTSPPLEVFLDVDGQAFVPAPMFVDMVSDNCGIASYEVVGGVAVPPIDECGDNVGAPINNTLPPAESVATVAETGIVGVDYTLDNVNIEITHTWTGDLDIELTSPAGTTLLLSGGNGSSGDNYTGTIFMDGAPSITTGSAPFTGTFAPEGGTFAATFDGEEVNGDWTLSVTDNVGGDNGTLDEYCLDFIPINPSQALFTCDDVGETTVDIIVTDTGGNTATCTAAVTVIDNIDPMLVCQDFTLELGPDGTAMLDPMDLINMDLTVEACGISVDAVSMDDFSCDDIGNPQVVTLFVSDPSGNLASCEATVTVVDLLGPEVTCPADMTVDPGADNQLYEVPDYFADGLASATDNCTDPVTVFAQEPVAGSFIGDGVYTVTLSATDEYGNVGTCTFELTVESILGVEDSALDTGLVLYPNPAQDQVILSNATNILLEKATMFDVNGKLVNTIDLSGMQGEQAIDISKLASGVYIVQIEAENASVVKRLIKE